MKQVKAAALAMVLAGAMVAVDAPARAQSYSAADLGGRWQGAFIGDGQTPTLFELTMEIRGDRVIGVTVETNNFAPGEAIFLPANIVGKLDGDRLSFTKTYDGTAGQSHSIAYAGRVLPGGRRIVGTWSVDALSGSFELAR